MNIRSRKRIVSLTFIIIFILSLLTNSVLASTNLQDLSHQVGVSTNKVWTVRLSKNLHGDLRGSLKSYVYVTSPRDGVLNLSITYDEGSKSIIINPPSGGYKTSTTYSIIVKDGLYDTQGEKLDLPTVKEFSTVNSSENVSDLGNVSQYQLNYSLDTFANNQVNNQPVVIRYFGYSTNYAEKTDILQYANPNVFTNDRYGIYQFMNLNYVQGISVSTLSNILSGKGILSGYGQAFENACRAANVNQAYAISHALLETGNGTSDLARGILVDGDKGKKTVYNFFGIGAYDSNPEYYGSQKAYELGWDTPEKALIGGVKWIGDQYINSSYQQNTIYKMRWNGNSQGTPTHQYATDIAWSYKQINNIKNIIDKCSGAQLRFDIPSYK